MFERAGFSASPGKVLHLSALNLFEQHVGTSERGVGKVQTQRGTLLHRRAWPLIGSEALLSVIKGDALKHVLISETTRPTFGP